MHLALSPRNSDGYAQGPIPPRLPRDARQHQIVSAEVALEEEANLLELSERR